MASAETYFKVFCISFLSLIFFTLVMMEIQSFNAKHSSTHIPPPSNVACMARYIVHQSDWCSLSYISHQGNTSNYPMARVFSVSDGNINDTTGDIYFMVSPIDITIQDLKINNNCSVIMSLAQEPYCSLKKYDPQDPRCGQTVLTGKFSYIDKESPQWTTAENALWTRHPIMKFWYYGVPGHKFQFAKLIIENIYIVDYFGGRKFPSVESYYNATHCIQEYFTI